MKIALQARARLPRPAKRLFFSLLVVAGLLAFAELACAIVFHVFSSWFTWHRPERYLASDADLAVAEQQFHPVLGWKTRADTPFGERPRPREYGRVVAAAFGDSFTYCDEVGDEDTWENRLAEHLQGDVFNFGNGGYGTDQAYLRFKEDFSKVRAPVAILGIVTENINRCVNVHRRFYFAKTGICLTKPRFLLTDDGLELLENPLGSADDLRLLQDPSFLRKLAGNDWWWNRDRYPVLAFPYTRILLSRRLWLEMVYGRGNQTINDVLPRPWTNLWEVPEARGLMLAIVDRFAGDAKAAGATPVVVLLPLSRDVARMVQAGSAGPGRRLVEHCAERGYVHLDAVALLAAAVDEPEDYYALYREHGHVSPEGNALIGTALAELLDKQGLIP